MELAKDDIDEFIDIWEAEFGERLSPDEARFHANRLLELYRALARPFPESSDADPVKDEQQ